jgi:ADA HAT complex component 1
VEGDERTATPSTATTEAKPGPSLASPAPSAPPKLSQPLKRSRSKKNIPSMMPAFDDSDKEDKHVSFVHSDENPKSKRGHKPAPSGR